MGTRIGSGFGIFKGGAGGTGSSVNIYNTSDSLTGDRTVDLNAFGLTFNKNYSSNKNFRVESFPYSASYANPYFNIDRYGGVDIAGSNPTTNDAYALSVSSGLASQSYAKVFGVGLRGGGKWDGFQRGLAIGDLSNAMWLYGMYFHDGQITISNGANWNDNPHHILNMKNNTSPKTLLHQLGQGSMVIGGSSAISGEFLSIQGHTLIQGQGSTSATTALEIKNSLGVDALIVRDDSRIGVRGNPDNDFILNVTGEGTTNAKGSIQAVNSLGTKMFSVDNAGNGFFNKDLQIVNRAAINSTISSTWALEVKGFTSNTAEGAFNFVNSSNDLIMKGVNNQEVIFGGAIAVGQTSSPTSSALVEMTSTTKGFLLPRMTTTQKNAITTPATSLMVFDTDLSEFNYYNGTAWSSFGGGNSIYTADDSLTSTRTVTFNGNDLIFNTSASNRFRIWNGSGNINSALSFWDAGSANMATSFYTWTLKANNATVDAIKVQFNGETSFGKDVRIGTSVSVLPAAGTKLHITGNGSTSATTALLVENSLSTSLLEIDDSGSIGIGIAPTTSYRMYVNDASRSGILANVNGANATAIFGQNLSSSGTFNTGVTGSAGGSSASNTGVEGRALGTSTGVNLGGYFRASGGTSNYAIRLVDGTEALGKVLKSDANGYGSWDGESEVLVVAASDETTDLTTGAAKVTFRMPYAMTLEEVRASVTTAPTGANLTCDINESGTSVLSTVISIDAGEKTSVTAVTPPVISDSALADDAEITIDIDQVGSTVAGTGLKVYLIGKRA